MPAMSSVLGRNALRYSTLPSISRSQLINKPSISLLVQTNRFLSQSLPKRSAEAIAPPPVATKHSLPRRFFTVLGIAIVFTGTGFIMSAIPAIETAQAFINPPSDAETLTMYVPEDKTAQEIEDYINNHPLAKELRSKHDFSEARPHLQVPPALRGHNLTAGTLMGPDRVVVPPFTWSERGGKSLVQISYLGKDLCGHPGIVHGGFLATMLDEGLARCCFAALPNKIGMTANLNINYRSPAPAEAFVVLRAVTTKVEGRKAWVEGRIETLVPEGETPRVIAEATALFIEPRQAATMARVYPTN